MNPSVRELTDILLLKAMEEQKLVEISQSLESGRRELEKSMKALRDTGQRLSSLRCYQNFYHSVGEKNSLPDPEKIVLRHRQSRELDTAYRQGRTQLSALTQLCSEREEKKRPIEEMFLQCLSRADSLTRHQETLKAKLLKQEIALEEAQQLGTQAGSN